MITVKTEPSQYTAGYSPIPYRVKSDAVQSSNNFKYIFSIVFNKFTMGSFDAVTFNHEVSTKVYFTTPHDFKVGDTIIAIDPVTLYSGYYYVQEVSSTISVIINLVLKGDIDDGTKWARVVKYKMPPDLDGEAKVDFSNVIKDYVTQDFIDTPETFPAPNTLIDFTIISGEERQFVFEFDDNVFAAGKVGFNDESMTEAGIDDMPFKIGDQIRVEQELTEWQYNNITDGTTVVVSSSGAHSFRIGQQLTITGQTGIVSYNGLTTGVDVTSTTITINKAPAGTSSESGSLFGFPRPEYNTVGTITNISYSVSLGVTIQTDISYSDVSVVIGGKITFADNRNTQFVNIDESDNITAYNAFIKQSDYSKFEFNNYVVTSGMVALNNLSTILTPLKRYRIERSSKSWLLNHSKDTAISGQLTYKFYSSSGVLLSDTLLENASINTKDYYSPVGIDQLISSDNTDTTSGSDLETIADQVSYYTVCGTDTVSETTNKITFFVNDDCSRFELLHLCWKDSLGSFLSYPFKYISNDVTDFDRKTFYKSEGEFNTLTDAFDLSSTGDGETCFFNRQRDKVILNTGFVKDYENELIKDLLGSPKVMIQSPDGVLTSCVITNKAMELNKSQNKPIYNYKIEVRKSTNQVRF